MPPTLPTLPLPGTRHQITRLGLGTMQLSLPGRPDRGDAKAVVRRAVEAGVRLLDTADTYALDQAEVGHGERLIAEALSDMGLRVDDGPVVVATKGGRTRHGGEWGLDGRPEHLRAAAESSLRALASDRIRLYQLHAPDPDVPFVESVGELSRLRDEGKVEAVGLSNVTVDQIEEAGEIVPVASVQNPHSLWDVGYRESPVLRHCRTHGIVFLAYGPLGGSSRAPRLSEAAGLAQIAAEMGVTVQQMALAWLVASAPVTVPIPGASRPGRIDDNVEALALSLDEEALARIRRAARQLPGHRSILVRIRDRIVRMLGR